MNKHERCTAIYGRRGSGKTTLVKQLVGDRPRLVVFDPMGEYARTAGFRRVASVAGVLAQLKAGWGSGFRIAFDVQGDYAEQLHSLAVLLWQAQEPYDAGRDCRPITLVVEEMNLGYPATSQRRNLDGFTHACLQGRHRGLEVIGVTQRPALVHPNFRGNAAVSYIFALEDEGDVAVMLKKLGRKHDAQLRGLADFAYLRIEAGQVSVGQVRR